MTTMTTTKKPSRLMKAQTQRSQLPAPNRVIGMGQAPTDALYEQAVLPGNFSQCQLFEYTTWSGQLPITDAEVAATFDEELDILQEARSVSGVDTIDTSFSKDGTLQCDMMVLGFGFHATASPSAWAIDGNSLEPAPTVATPPPISMDVFSTADLVQTLNLPGGTSMVPANLQYGMPAWEMLYHLFNAYRFQWIMCRNLLIDESVKDVGFFCPPEAAAAGTMDTPIYQKLGDVNARYRAKGANAGIFMPIDFRRLGSVNTNPAAAANAGVGTITRDFELAETMVGGLQYTPRGQAFRRCRMPFLLPAGTDIGMKLVAQNSFHLAEMQKLLSISGTAVGGAGGNLETDQIDTFVNGTTAVAAANAALELTLDPPGPANVFTNLRMNTDRRRYKGGEWQLSMYLKGYQIITAEWMTYLNGQAKNGTIVTPDMLAAAPMQLAPR